LKAFCFGNFASRDEWLETVWSKKSLNKHAYGKYGKYMENIWKICKVYMENMQGTIKTGDEIN